MTYCILKVLYLILVLCIIYDVFGNFFRVWEKTRIEIKNTENNLKENNYIKYLLYSLGYPLFTALKQWRVMYPIVLFVFPPLFVYLLGQNEVFSINSFIKENIFWFMLVFAFIAYVQNKKSKK